jgi:hypothetical protein
MYSIGRRRRSLGENRQGEELVRERIVCHSKQGIMMNNVYSKLHL